jgi:hypothetical protein
MLGATNPHICRRVVGRIILPVPSGSFGRWELAENALDTCRGVDGAVGGAGVQSGEPPRPFGGEV